MRFKNYQCGFTLIETIITITIISVTAAVSLGLIRLLNNTSNQKAMIESQRLAQIALNMVTQDIKNAQQIVQVNSDSLILNAYDYTTYRTNHTKGTAIAMNYNPTKPPQEWLALNSSTFPLYQTSNIGTITYQVTGSGSGSYLKRTTVFHGVRNEKILLNHLMATPINTTNYLFRPLPDGTPPIQSVEIVLRIRYSDFSKIYLFRNQAMMRGSGFTMAS